MFKWFPNELILSELFLMNQNQCNQSSPIPKQMIVYYIYVYAFSRRFYPKWLTGYTFLSVCVFPGNWTHNL